MPDFSGTTSTGLVGVKEDVTDEAFVISDRDAVLFHRLKSGPEPKQVQVSVVADDIPPPRTEPVAEHSDVTSFADMYARRQNISTYRQQFRADWGISRAVDNTMQYGVRNAIAEAQEKCSQQHINSLEAAFLSDQDHEDNSNQRPRCRGLGLWTRSYASRNFGGITMAGDSRKDSHYWPSTEQNIGGDLSALNIDDLDQLALSLFTATGTQGKRLMIISGPKFALRFNKLAKNLSAGGTEYGNQRFTAGQTAGKITDKVTMYEGIFSNLECVPSYFIGWKEDEGDFDRDRAYFLDFEHMEKRFNYVDMNFYKPVEGNNLGGWRESMGTLVVTNPKCMGQWRPTSGFGTNPA